MRRARGFTLLEVMIGLAILAFALVVLVRSAATSMGGAFDAELMGVATTLSRSKMNDIEELLLKDGFTETDQSLGECGEPTMKPGVATSSGGGAEADRNPDAISKSIDDVHAAIRERAKSGKTFEDEGWPKFSYTYRIEAVELPPWEQLQEMTKARQGSGAGSGSDEEGGFENSTLGGMMSQFGGFGGPGGGDIDAMQGASLIQGQYQLFQQILEDSLRKVTLCVYYEASGWPIELKTVAYFTDPSAMDKALQGLGAQELPETDGAGSGSGTGTGTGSGTRTPTGSGGGRGGR